MRNHRRSRLSLAVAALCSVVAAASPALGQGTQGAVPDPINSRDLARWAQRLELSSEQQEAVGRLHEVYLAEFRVLREGEVEALIQRVGGMFMGGFRNINREQVEATAKDNGRIMSQIKGIDDRFLDSMRTALSEEQAAMLPRIMDWRARQRYASGASRMVGRVNQAARVDLGELYDDLELSEPDRQASEPVIVQYEGRLTSLSRELYEVATAMFLDVVEGIEAQGIDMANIQNLDPAERGRMMQAMAVVWSEATAKPREQAHKITELNRQTMKQLSALLSVLPADQLQSRYLRRAYPEVPRTRAAERSLRTALQIEGLPQPTVQEIEVLDLTFRARRSILVDEMIEYLDGFRREAGMNQFFGPGRRAHRDRLDEFEKRFDDLEESTVQALQAMLGADGAVRLAGALANRDRDDAGGGAAGPGPANTVYNQPGPDPFLPRPISGADVRNYRVKLGLPDEERFILESLHEDYLASWAGIHDTDMVALHKGLAILRRSERRDEVTATPADVALVYDLRRRIIASVIALDGAFFDDLETIIEGDAQQATLRRLRQERQSIVYNRGLAAMEDFGGMFAFGPGGPGGGDRGGDRGDRGGGRGGQGQGGPGGPGGGGFRFMIRGQESSVDLASLVGNLTLPDEERAALNATLDSYSVQVAEAFRVQYETLLRLREDADMRRFQPRDENQDGRQRWEGMREAMEASRAQVRQASEPIVSLNRATLAKVSDGLPAEQATALRRAYNRWAYPAAYDEASSAGRFLDTARGLPELDAEQLKRIGAIRSEYGAAYESVCEKIVGLYGESDNGQAGFDPEFFRSMQERRSKIEMLEFDRTEANAKAIRQLRSVLDEQQQARIGLPALEPASG